jgi:hypothetical protein
MDEYFDLGENPKRINDVGYADKMIYPTLHISDLDDVPGICEMRLKDVGEAKIRFRIDDGCLKVIGIKVINTAPNVEDEMNASGESPKKPKTRGGMNITDGSY